MKFKRLFVTTLVVLCFILFSCVDKQPNSESNTPPVRQTVVVEKIILSNGKYQYFIVSGKNFEFSTEGLTFDINDTIVIEGDKAFPKNKPSNFVDIE